MQLNPTVFHTQTETVPPAIVKVIRLRAYVERKALSFEPCQIAAVSCVITRILDIQDRFDYRGEEKWEWHRWNDPLSERIFKWIDQFNKNAEIALTHSARHDEAQKKTIALIEELASKVLQNPMDLTLFDNPLIEGNCYVWGEKKFNFAKSRTNISPYTQKPFEVHPHELARAILAWGKEFFPTLFTPSEGNAEAADPCEFKLIEMNARSIVRWHTAHNLLKEAQRQLKATQEKADQTEQSNLQLLLERNLRVEQQIRQEGALEIERLRAQLSLQHERFERRTNQLEVDLREERQARIQLRMLLTTLEVHAHALEGRVASLELENGQLRQSLACAYGRLNQDGGSSCSIM